MTTLERTRRFRPDVAITVSWKYDPVGVLLREGEYTIIEP